jgi:cell division protein FtsL
VARYEAQAYSESHYHSGYAEDSGLSRSDAAAYYGGLFSPYRAGSSVYGGLLDDAPRSPSERRHERRRSKASERGVHISRYSRPALPHISHAEKSIMIFIAVFIAAIFIGVIALEAYSVSIQHEINKTNTQAADIQKEIDDLYVAIEQGKNIGAIEKSAKKKLDMSYPSSGQIKYEKDIKVKNRDVDLSEKLRSEAYGA